MLMEKTVVKQWCLLQLGTDSDMIAIVDYVMIITIVSMTGQYGFEDDPLLRTFSYLLFDMLYIFIQNIPTSTARADTSQCVTGARQVHRPL